MVCVILCVVCNILVTRTSLVYLIKSVLQDLSNGRELKRSLFQPNHSA